jgi:hypothetical protein
MSAKGLLTEIKSVFEIYRQSLDNYSDAQFEHKSDANIWSLAQMYEHVCMTGKKFFLANTKRCLEKRNGEEGGEMNAKGAYVFANGGFPDVKVKMPEAVAVIPIVGRGREIYKKEIEEILASAEVFANVLDADAGTYKIPHPVFGPLNANQWYQNLEMHTRHHLRQKAELETLSANV